MKQKYPYFPHCTSASSKKWEEELLTSPYKILTNLIHPIGEIVQKYYPYFALMNDVKQTVVFFDRQYKAMGEQIKADQTIYEYSLIKMPKGKFESQQYDNFSGYIYYFFNDRGNPCTDEKFWIEYWEKVFNFCHLVKEVPVFIRYQMWSIKELYTQACLIKEQQQKIIKLEKQLQRKNSNDSIK